MSHPTATREQWLTARLALLEEEKELTRRNDELARRRQELPWVRLDKPYRFDTLEGSVFLAECIVAYAALFTGIGISITTAHWIQLLLWALCLISLAYLAFTRIPFSKGASDVHRPSHARRV